MLPLVPIAARVGARFVLPAIVGVVASALSIGLAVLRNKSEHSEEESKEPKSSS